MKTAKLFFLVGVIILAGIAFLFYKKYSNPPQKQPSIAESKKLISNLSNNMKISSPVFENNGNIPAKYTCDGEGVNPSLAISDVPESAKSLTLIMDDPDAPLAGGFVHWVAFNLDPATLEIKENSKPESGIEGTNSAGKTGYMGPCPPRLGEAGPPSGTHHYEFGLYALDEKLNFDSSAKKIDIEKAIEGHILDQTLLVGLYQRK